MQSLDWQLRFARPLQSLSKVLDLAHQIIVFTLRDAPLNFDCLKAVHASITLLGPFCEISERIDGEFTVLARHRSFHGIDNDLLVDSETREQFGILFLPPDAHYVIHARVDWNNVVNVDYHYHCSLK
jgi:hypothetical protein